MCRVLLLVALVPLFSSVFCAIDVGTSATTSKSTFEYKHHDYEDLTAVLIEANKRCPDVTYLYNLTGEPDTTWEGRHLNVIVFSDKPEQHELGK